MRPRWKAAVTRALETGLRAKRGRLNGVDDGRRVLATKICPVGDSASAVGASWGRTRPGGGAGGYYEVTSPRCQGRVASTREMQLDRDKAPRPPGDGADKSHGLRTGWCAEKCWRQAFEKISREAMNEIAGLAEICARRKGRILSGAWLRLVGSRFNMTGPGGDFARSGGGLNKQKNRRRPGDALVAAILYK